MSMLVLALELAASWASTGMANKRVPANKNGVRDFILGSPLYVMWRCGLSLHRLDHRLQSIDYGCIDPVSPFLQFRDRLTALLILPQDREMVPRINSASFHGWQSR